MIEVKGDDRLLSVGVRKRFGKSREFGTMELGYSEFGAEDEFLILSEFGNNTLGVSQMGDMIPLSGIYQTRKTAKGIAYYRSTYFVPRNPRTEAQQSWRQVFQEGAQQWQLLSDEQKKVWNEKAIGKNLYGYNLFMEEYLQS